MTNAALSVQPAPESDAVGKSFDKSLKALAPVLILAAAYIPLLILHATRLWATPHLQFFPLLLVGSGILAWRHASRLGPLEPGQTKPVLWLLGVCWGLLLIAGLVMAPSPGTMIALLTLPIAAYAWGGWRLLKGLWPALLLLWMAIPVPFDYDQTLIRNMRTMATDTSSGVLDVLGVDHLPLGNVIEIPGKTLTVEAACSGIQSLYVVLAATLFFVLLTQATVLRSLMLLATAVLWVLIGNILRLVVVVGGYARWGLDLSSGWPHELLGIVILFFTLAMIASTDSLYRLSGMLAKAIWNGAKVQWRKFQRKQGKSKNRSKTRNSAEELAESAPDLEVVASDERGSVSDLGPTRFPALARTSLVRWPVLAAFGLLALVQCVWLWPALSFPYLTSFAVVEIIENKVSADTLPSAVGPMIEPKYQAEHRELESDFGQNSRIWNYQFGPNQAIVSVDFPFQGYHELTVCYINSGWKLEKRTLTDGPSGPRVEADFTMPSGRHAFLLFQAFDAQGVPIQLPVETGGSPFVRLRKVAKSLKVWDAKVIDEHWRKFVDSEQIQVFVEGPRALTEAEREQARTLHDTARERVLDAIGASRRTNS